MISSSELLSSWEKSVRCPDLGATHRNLAALNLRRAAIEMTEGIQNAAFLEMSDRAIGHLRDLNLQDISIRKVFSSYPELSTLIHHCAYLRSNKTFAFSIKNDALESLKPWNALSAFDAMYSLTNDSFVSLEFSTYFEEPKQRSGLIQYLKKASDIANDSRCSNSCRARVKVKIPQISSELNFHIPDSGFIEHFDLDNWMATLRDFIRNEEGLAQAKEVLSKKLNPEKLEIVLTSAQALNFDNTALQKFLLKPLFMKADTNIVFASANTINALIRQACRQGLFSLEIFDFYMRKALESGNIDYITGFLYGDLPLKDRIRPFFGFLKDHQRYELILELFRKPRTNLDLAEFVDEVVPMAVKLQDYPITFASIQLSDGNNIFRDNFFIGFLKNELLDEAFNFFSLNYREFASPFESATLVPNLRRISTPTLLQLIARYECKDEHILAKVAKHELLNSETSENLEKLFKTFQKDKSIKTFELIFEIPQGRSRLTNTHLEEALKESNSIIKPQVTAELGLRLLADRGDKAKIRALAEKYAHLSAECAHLMYLITGEAKWIRQVLEQLDSEEISELKARFDSAGLAPATELDDPNLHRELIREKESEAETRARRQKILQEELWICRRRVGLNESRYGNTCAYHQAEPQLDAVDEKSLFEQVKLSRHQGNFEKFGELQDGWFQNRVQEQKKSLYRWQEQALDSWVEHGRTGIVEAVTGSGKTLVALRAIAEAVDADYSVLVVVPTRVLGDQWMDRTLDVFDRMGRLERIGNVTTNLNVPISIKAKSGFVTIAVLSGQLPSKIDHWIKASHEDTKKMIVIDEVHRISGKLYSTILKNEFTRRLGLTATLLPNDYDGSALKNYFCGDSIYRYTFENARLDNVIAPYKLFALGVEIPINKLTDYQEAEFTLRRIRDHILSETRKKISVSEFPDYAEGLRQNGKYIELVNQYFIAQEKVDEIVASSTSSSATRALQLTGQLIKRIGKTAIFSDFKVNAVNCETALKAVGIDARVITGETSSIERENALRDLQSEKNPVKVVIAPKVLDEGVDVENLTIGLFAGIQRHRRALIQRLGRVLRKHPAKDCAYVFIIFTVGTSDDPTIENGLNKQLQLSQFDFVGKNAEGEIESFVIGKDDERLKKRLQEL